MSEKDLPDLESAQEMFADAHALVNVAYQIVVNGKNQYGESTVLRLALQMLDKASDQLDDAVCQLARLRGAES